MRKEISHTGTNMDSFCGVSNTGSDRIKESSFGANTRVRKEGRNEGRKEEVDKSKGMGKQAAEIETEIALVHRFSFFLTSIPIQDLFFS